MSEIQCFVTREEWLNYVADEMRPLFTQLGYALPKNIRVSIGFTSMGVRSKAIGQCWDLMQSEDQHFEIFIVPNLDTKSEFLRLDVAAVLAHELSHAAVGIEEGHKRKFKDLVTGLGLEGPAKATVSGPKFESNVMPILHRAGPFPHARLDTTRAKKIQTQTTRYIKCVCSDENCSYTVRITRKWILDIGPPHCPKHLAMTPIGLEELRSHSEA